MYFLTVLEARGSKIKMPAGLVSGGASLLGVQTAAFSLRPHLASLCTQDRALSVASSYKDTSPIGLGLHLLTSFNLMYLPQVPVSTYSHFRGLGPKHTNVEGTQFSP